MDNFTKLYRFRSLFGMGISKDESIRIWGKMYRSDVGKEKRSIFVDRKKKIAKENLSVLLLGKLVKFIGISGSVASGFAKKDDDIDVFVVVRDGTMWLYRALVQIRNISQGRIRRKREKSVKDKFCLNLIAEERGLTFDCDIFNLNELMYLIPIYNEKYVNYIYSQNQWLVEEYSVKKDCLITNIKPQKQANMFFRILNKLLYCFQLAYMKIANHQPDIERLERNSKKGRIEFFSKKFKEKKIENYLKEFKSIS